MSTYERVVNILADGAWHRFEELRTVSRYPDRWLDELRRDGLEVEEVNGMVLLLTPGCPSRSGSAL